MFTSFLNLIKLKHYKGAKSLKIFSGLQFYLTLILIFLPFFSEFIFKAVLKLYEVDVTKIDPQIFKSAIVACNIFAWIIALLSAINLIKEYGLSKSNIVSLEFRKELIKQLITFLMDRYEWQGTCRASLFVPYQNKLKIYERISWGIGASDFVEGKVFFRMGQGIPGKAWETASSGTDINEIIRSIQVGNIPSNILRDENATRRFFKENFKIADNDIYDSLGPNKRKIQSYMAVGILGRHQKLIAVLAIDSEEPEKFTDFETLKIRRDGKFTQELTFVGESNGNPAPDFLPPEMLGQMRKLLPDGRKKIKNADGWEKQKEAAKNVAVMALAAHQSVEMKSHAPSFVYPIQWVLNQIKEIFTMDV